MKPIKLLLAMIVAGSMLCSCSNENDESVGDSAKIQPTLQVGRQSYSFGNAYWSCSFAEGDTRAERDTHTEGDTRAEGEGNYVCDLQFFSFDYYRALSAGGQKSMPERFSFMVFSFETDHFLSDLESMTIPAGKWRMTGAINMPRYEGESDYYLADAAGHPNGDLHIERTADGYTVSIDPVYVDYERGGDKTWFVIESPFVYSGNIKCVTK